MNSDETIKIGNQVWMKYNLNVDKFRNGEPIQHCKSNEEWIRAGEECQPAWCFYENAGLKGEKYGRLYNWYAVNDPRGLAPEGFHVPSIEEWDELTEYVGESEAGTILKSRSGWAEDGNGTDEVGFSALPGGRRYLDNGTFYYVGYLGGWWSSTALSDYNAWYRSLSYGNAYVNRVSNYKRIGFSVRCLRD